MSDSVQLMADIGRLAAIAAAVYGLTRLLAHPRNPWNVLDVPNARSLHSVPVPRTGGLAILAGLALACILFGPHGSRQDIVAGGALVGIALVSWRDDRASLPPATRLAAQFAAAAVTVVWGGVRWTGALLPGVPLALPSVVRDAGSVVYLTWCMNLYNFMDGMDGLAGGMAVFGFGTLAALGARAGAVPFALTGGAISAAAFGFTVSNYPPARLFMGDAGSVPLGFLFGVMTLVASRGVAPLWVGILIFSPFCVDASVTLIRRLWRGENPAQAHREHYYQRLVMGGLGSARVVTLEYGLMGLCAVSAWWAAIGSRATQWVIIAVWACAYAALAMAIERWQGG